MLLPSLLLSSGGAQLDRIACMAGNVTPCAQQEGTTYVLVVYNHLGFDVIFTPTMKLIILSHLEIGGGFVYSCFWGTNRNVIIRDIY